MGHLPSKVEQCLFETVCHTLWIVYYYKHHLAVQSLSKIKLVECTDFTLLQLRASCQGFDCVYRLLLLFDG